MAREKYQIFLLCKRKKTANSAVGIHVRLRLLADIMLLNKR